jgi:hypothetical protein
LQPKSEQNRAKQSIQEQCRVKYLKISNPNGFFTDLLKKLLTFASFCSIFYYIIYNEPLRRQTAKAERGCIIEKKCDH